MQTLTVASEKGGVGKTTVTLGLAAELARRGVRVGIIDLDPRSTATTWLGVEAPPGEHIGAIMGLDDVDGAAADLALASTWSPLVTIVPGSRDLAALEAAPQEYGDLRLRRALEGWDRDVVLIDSPNRQGGFLIRAALVASQRVLYTTTPDEDGRTGVAWARHNVARFRQLSPLNPGLQEAGVVVTRWPDNIPSRDAKGAVDALRDDVGDLLLTPFVPERVIVRSARAAEEWWGGYDRGAPIAGAFAQLVDALWPEMRGTHDE